MRLLLEKAEPGSIVGTLAKFKTHRLEQSGRQIIRTSPPIATVRRQKDSTFATWWWLRSKDVQAFHVAHLSCTPERNSSPR